MTDEITRRMDRLEREHDDIKDSLNKLVLSTQRMADLLETQKTLAPKIEDLTSKVHALEIVTSNANLVQRAFVWGAGIIGGSAIVMAMTFLFRGA